MQLSTSLTHLFLKEVYLPCRGLVTEPLAQLLQKPHEQEKGDLKVTISYVHPSSASESDYLYGKAKRVSRSRKRKSAEAPAGEPLSALIQPGITTAVCRSRQIMSSACFIAGRFATEDIAIRSAKQSYENFCEHAAVPPQLPDQAVHLLLSCRRMPQYIGGLYRKLER